MKLKYNSPVILTFTLAATVLFLLNLLLFNSLTLNVLALPGRGYFSFNNFGDYIKILTYSFAHSDFGHLLGNFSFVLLLGPILEEKYGSVMLFFLMLITAAVIGFIQALFLSGLLLGASGLVFMMIIMVSFTNIRKGELPITMILVALLYLAKEIYTGLAVQNNISEMAHIAGGFCGIIFGFLIHGSDDKQPEAQPGNDPSLSR